MISSVVFFILTAILISMKRCHTCEQDKDLTDFHKNKSTGDGLQTVCKACRHVKRVSKWADNPSQTVTRTRNGKVQKYTRGPNTGDSKTPLYRRWKSMRERCGNPNAQNYKFYGAKGIRVCEQWQNSFPAFKEWALSSGYAPHLELDRIDSSKNYSPENCRWLSKRENIKLARMSLSTKTAALLSEEATLLSMSQEALIAKIVEEHYSQRYAAKTLGGDA
jgi:hypothetical protein